VIYGDFILMGIARKKPFKIDFVLVIKVNSSIYVRKELQTADSTRVAVPVCCMRHSADAIPPPPRKKSSDLDELQGTPMLLWEAQALQPLLVAPLYRFPSWQLLPSCIF
jgi:hypothetical protein